MRWITVAATLVACGDPTPAVSPDAAPPGTIGAAGGTVSLAGGPTITVPAGALDHDVVITINDTGGTPAGSVTTVYEFQPDGLTFAVPATVTFPLAKPPLDLAVYWSNATGYDRLAATTTATTISAQVSHFSMGYAGGVNPGFVAPTAAIIANGGTLDLSCLGSARNDATSTQHILTAHVTDFQSGNVDANALITVFPSSDVSGVSLSTATTDSSGNAPVSISAGHKRVAFQIMATNSVPTYAFDLLASATSLTSFAMANSTMATLPALIGVTPTQGASLVVDKVTDCQGHPLQNLIGTVSSTKGTATSLAGADTYYFNGAVGLPTKHASQMTTDTDGQLMVINLPAATTAYLQAWGYRNASELAAQQLTLIAEVQIAVPQASAVIQDQTPASTTP